MRYNAFWKNKTGAKEYNTWKPIAAEKPSKSKHYQQNNTLSMRRTGEGMAEILKTKNGYKMRVYLGREEVGKDEHGKPIFKAIIRQIPAPTRAELKRKEAQLIAENKDPKGTRSFRTAIKTYIRDKEQVLSPATTANYRRVQATLEGHCPWFMDMDIAEIDKPAQQRMVSELSDSYALNTVKTINSTVSSVLRYNDVPSHIVKFNEGADTSSETDRYIPTEDVIRRLIADCRDTDLEPAVLLAAFGPMRRGEIGGLKTRRTPPAGGGATVI